jgi:hypothetical protein
MSTLCLHVSKVSSPSRDPVPLEHLHVNPIWLNAESLVCLGVGVPVAVSGAQGVPPEEPTHHGQRGNLTHLRVVVHHLHQRLINYKDTKTKCRHLKNLPVWRIRDVYPGSRILIFNHPGSRISDPGSRIQKQQQKREVKKNLLSYLFM